MNLIRKWRWLVKRILVYVPFGIVILYLFLNKHFIANSYIGLPKPTYTKFQKESYSLENFGAPIKAGFAKRNITPFEFLPASLAGFTPWHHGWLIHDQLWAKSLTLQDKKGNTIIIVSCDLIGLLPDEITKIRSLVKNKNVNPDNIFINTTHTHSGPDTMGIWGFYAPISLVSGKNEKYLKGLRKKVAEAIDASIENLQESSIRFAQGEFLNRANGRDGNPPDPTVSTIQVLASSQCEKTCSLGKSYIPVTLVNFAVHADIVESLQISADFPYYLSERLWAITGGETMFIPGAIGGVQPKGDRSDGPNLARCLGEGLADRVMELLKNPVVPDRADISVIKISVSAPLENWRFSLLARLGVISDILNENGKVLAEVSRVRIGPAEILTVPGELFPKIWWRVKSKMRGNPKMIFGLTNGEFGYILLPEDVRSEKNKYHVGVSVGPMFGEEIDKALQKLTEY